jgi:hypothetical protein
VVRNSGARRLGTKAFAGLRLIRALKFPERPANVQRSFQSGSVTLPLCGNEGTICLLASAPYLTRSASAAYSSLRRKKSSIESGDWPIHALGPACADRARGVILGCILACVESKHDSVMLRGSAPRTPKSKAGETLQVREGGRVQGKEEGNLEMSDKAIMFAMDDARREKFKIVSGKVVDLLRAEMESPVEAYALLQFVRSGFEELYGIRGTVIYGGEEEAHS